MALDSVRRYVIRRLGGENEKSKSVDIFVDLEVMGRNRSRVGVATGAPIRLGTHTEVYFHLSEL